MRWWLKKSCISLIVLVANVVLCCTSLILSSFSLKAAKSHIEVNSDGSQITEHDSSRMVMDVSDSGINSIVRLIDCPINPIYRDGFPYCKEGLIRLPVCSFTFPQIFILVEYYLYQYQKSSTVLMGGIRPVTSDPHIVSTDHEKYYKSVSFSIFTR